MNHLYIIGNGFDLAHGLKTSYRDFILWYINKQLKFIVDSQQGVIKIDDKLMRITRPSCNCIFGNTDRVNDIKSFYDKISEIGRITRMPVDIIYSSLLKSIIDKDGWANIEKEYYSLMVKIISDDPKIRLGLDIKELNSSLERLKIEFKKYLIEKVLSEIETKEPIEDIKRAINRDDIPGGNKQLFLSFNYSDTLQRLYHSIVFHKEADVINIHGEVESPENPIIFGYGDEMDKNFKDLENRDENDFLDNMKSFGYFQTDNYKKILKFIGAENGDYKVHLIGHSLGLSDRLLLNTIFEHENCKKIEIHYHQWKDVENKQRNNFYQLAKNLSRHFNLKFKGKMREIVVSFLDSKPIDH